MIFDSKIFYQTYQRHYHLIKAKIIKQMLDNPHTYAKGILTEVNGDDHLEEIIRALKSDLRQTYFHAIETFFELFFAINPKNKKYYDDEKVLFYLTNSNWNASYKKVSEIAAQESALDFLNEKIRFNDNDITIGHYLFYMGIFQSGNFPSELFEEIRSSIEAIKYGIQIIANDFIDREEYNAYKHGLRIIPSVSKLEFSNVATQETELEWDLSDSMSFYLKTQNRNEVKVVTKLFDSDRDYQMILFCSNLIHHLIFFRRLAFKFENDCEKFTKFPITFFSKESIEKSAKINVPIQDLIYSVTLDDKTQN